MKSINVTFTDREFKELDNRKGVDTWRNFILRRAGVSLDEEL